MRRRFVRPHARAALLAGLLAGAAACSPDAGNPAAPRPPGGPVPPGTPVPVAAVACSADVKARTVRCDQPVRADGLPAYLIVGGQNVYVKVTTTNVTYDAGTGEFVFDLAVRNLIPQPLGTTDGTTLDPAGVRVFVVEGTSLPVLSGTGTVTVVPDDPGDIGTFTATGQPFYQYDEVLDQYELSGYQDWELSLPSTVESFKFSLLVAAAVQYPDGWIEVSPGTHSMPALGTRGLQAFVRNVVGALDSTVAVGWSTGDAGTATVAGTGFLSGTGAYTATATGVRGGVVTLTATDGVRSGSMDLTITGIVRAWTGAVSSDWGDGGNWNPVGVIPAPVDSVAIPTGVPNFPALTAATAIGGVSVDDGATLSLGAFDLTAGADVATGFTPGSGVLGAGGRLVLAGAGEAVHGRVPTLLVTGSYTLDGNLFVTAPGEVELGLLENELYELSIDAQ